MPIIMLIHLTQSQKNYITLVHLFLIWFIGLVIRLQYLKKTNDMHEGV